MHDFFSIGLLVSYRFMFFFIDWKLPPPACPGTTGMLDILHFFVLLHNASQCSASKDLTTHKITNLTSNRGDRARLLDDTCACWSTWVLNSTFDMTISHPGSEKS